MKKMLLIIVTTLLMIVGISGTYSKANNDVRMKQNAIHYATIVNNADELTFKLDEVVEMGSSKSMTFTVINNSEYEYSFGGGYIASKMVVTTDKGEFSRDLAKDKIVKGTSSFSVGVNAAGTIEKIEITNILKRDHLTDYYIDRYEDPDYSYFATCDLSDYKLVPTSENFTLILVYVVGIVLCVGVFLFIRKKDSVERVGIGCGLLATCSLLDFILKIVFSVNNRNLNFGESFSSAFVYLILAISLAVICFLIVFVRKKMKQKKALKQNNSNDNLTKETK